MNTKQLRQKILDLAIRGKLVPQNPDDEPASVLLEKIRTERQRLVKEKKSKPDKTSSISPYQNVPFEVPEGWVWVSGYECLRPMESKKPYGEKFRYIDIKSIDNKKHIITETKWLNVSDAPSRASRNVDVGDTLFSMVRPYLENIAYVDEEYANSIASTGFFVCKPTRVLNSRYLYYLMLSPYMVDGLNTFMKGDNSPSINNDNVILFLYPIPPISEQKRIVSVIETAFTLIDEIEASKTSLTESIKQVKTKVLDLAIRGKLVPQDPNDEPASVLLERSRKERKTKEMSVDNSHNKQVPKTPDNWEICKLSDICIFERGITFPSSAKQTTKLPNTITCVRTANVQESLDLNDLWYVDKSYMKKNPNKLLCDKDIMMSSANSKELVGKTVFIESVQSEMTFGGFVMIIRVYKANSKYIFYFLRDCFHKGLFASIATQTTNIANINSAVLGEIKVPIPPLSEQKRIVQRIETIFQTLDSIQNNL
jgi:type I restriction enzyme S subunit